MSAIPDSPWQDDILGADYQQRVLSLGGDPDGEGQIDAVLVRRGVRRDEKVSGAVLYVHGFAEHFFQTQLADFFASRGFAFDALDLRKSGRARRPGHTAHYVSDLRVYDQELEGALSIVGEECPGAPVLVVGHSTGGLITPLWLARRRSAGRVAPVAGLVLNSPWLDLKGNAVLRGPITWLLRVVAKLRPLLPVGAPLAAVYGRSLHTSGTGEWDYDLDLKPMGGFPVTAGWINAIRRGHAALHRGLDVGVPCLVMHSDKTHDNPSYSALSDRADLILDVEQIARWSSCLGPATSVVMIPDARHDVILSLPDVRQRAFEVLGAWMDTHPMLVVAPVPPLQPFH